MNRQRFLWGFVVALIPSLASAHEGHWGAAFHAHDWKEMCQASRDQHRLGLVWIQQEETDTTFSFLARENDFSLLSLIGHEVVLLEMTAAELRNAGISSQRDATLLLFDESQKLLADFREPIPPAWLERQIRREASQQSRISQVERALQSSSVDPFLVRERLACLYGDAGNDEKAAALFTQCAKQAIAESTPAARARRLPLFMEIAGFSKRADSSALIELIGNEVRDRLIQGLGTPRLAHDLGEFHRVTGLSESTLALFDALENDIDARRGLYDHVFGALVEQKRYQELLALIMPLDSFRGELAIYKRHRLDRPVSAERGERRGTKAFLLNRAGGLIEALAATNVNDEATLLLDRVLGFDNSRETQAKIHEHVHRSGNRTVAAHLARKAKQ